MIKEQKASMTTPSKLDIDYLFDNFNKFCRVEIAHQDAFREKPSGHKIIKNLTSTFDLVAMQELEDSQSANEYYSIRYQTDRVPLTQVGQQQSPRLENLPSKSRLEFIQEESNSYALTKGYLVAEQKVGKDDQALAVAQKENFSSLDSQKEPFKLVRSQGENGVPLVSNLSRKLIEKFSKKDHHKAQKQVGSGSTRIPTTARIDSLKRSPTSLFDTTEIVTSSFMQNSNKNKLLNVSELNEKKNRVNVAAGSRSKKSRSKNGSFIVNMNMNGNQSRGKHMNSNASISHEEGQYQILEKPNQQIFLSKEERPNKNSHLELRNHLTLLKSHNTADKGLHSKSKSKKKMQQNQEKLMSSVLKLKESFDNSQEPLIGQKLHLPFENNILHHGNKKYGQREAKSTERPQQQQFIGGFFLKSGTSMLTTKKVGLQEQKPIKRLSRLQPSDRQQISRVKVNSNERTNQNFNLKKLSGRILNGSVSSFLDRQAYGPQKQPDGNSKPVFKRSQTNESLLNVRIFEKQLIKQKMRGEKESQKSVLDRIFERIKIERKEDRESRSRENKAKSQLSNILGLVGNVHGKSSKKPEKIPQSKNKPMKNQQTSNSAETNKLRYLDQIYNKEVARMKIKPLVQLKLRDRSQDDSHNSNPLQQIRRALSMKNGGQNSVIQVPESQLSVKNTATNRRETLAKKFSQQRIVEHSRNASKLSNDQKRPEAKKSLRSKVPHPQKLKSSKHELSQKMEG